jgi:hypothetical protein
MSTTQALAIFQGTNPALFGPGWPGEALSGIAQLAQRFLVCLLTPAQSLLYYPQWGCPFVAKISTAKTETDVFQAFAMSKPWITKQLRQDETTATDPSERWQSAALNRIVLSNTSMQLQFQVMNRAGETQDVFLDFIWST